MSGISLVVPSTPPYSLVSPSQRDVNRAEIAPYNASKRSLETNSMGFVAMAFNGSCLGLPVPSLYWTRKSKSIWYSLIIALDRREWLTMSCRRTAVALLNDNRIESAAGT